MGEVLYDLVIRPIWLLLEIVFKTAYSICNNPGISIIFVSLVVNILVLPLYLKSDALQSDERKKQKDMEGWVKHIRRTFKGDERFMVLSEYYRQNNYQPYYVLKSSLSLLLQIPFFIAAYTFLSNLQLLRGVSFLFIKDLGMPDATFSLGGFSLNILPIAMTLINLASSIIYTRGGPAREKVQTIGMALVFLILLYNSPAGLVFYWTLNNLFSLFKNIVMEAGKRLELFRFAESDKSASDPGRATESSDPSTTRLWLISSVFITILLGMLIPLSVITAAPIEFIKRGVYADPTRYVITTTATSAGFFLVWSAVIFFLGTKNFRRIYSVVCAVLAAVFFFNYMFFSQNFGILFDDLIFSEAVWYSQYESLMNIVFIAYLAIVLVIIIRKRPQWVISALSMFAVAGFILGIYQSVQTSAAVRVTEKYKASVEEIASVEPVITLSKTGRNVVIFVMDKAMGAYIPFIMQEKPELTRDFSGFAFYPNTVSFAACTLLGSPAMYGGYEYTTYDINKRTDETLKDKLNQALTLIPSVFSKAGYHSTLCDIPNGNLNEYGDMTIFEGIDDCDIHRLTMGAYSSLMTEDEKSATNAEQEKRNFFFYSLLRSSPLALQSGIYDDGKYNSLSGQSVTNAFANSYVIMKNLPLLTQISNEDNNELFIMHNMMTHEDTLMDPPDYLLKSTAPQKVESDGIMLGDSGIELHMDNEEQLAYYETNMSAMLFIGKWLQTIKEMGVYDNTRIIIVADHGYPLWQLDDLANRDIDLDAMDVNPLLMVKDFDAKGDLKTDMEFMSNADVPMLAMDGVIQDPVNPFTGNPINSNRKEQGPLIVTESVMWDPQKHEENSFNVSDSRWYSIHDDIFDHDNWTIFKE